MTSEGLQKERDRQYRVMDEFLTMHAVLRDSYSRRATMLSVSLLAFAVLLNALVFTADDFLTAFGVTPTAARFGIGLASAILLIIAVFELRVDWSSRAREHEHAVVRLGRLKARFREAASLQPNGEEEFRQLGAEYARVFEEIVPIPERRFHALKARHVFKVELSKAISEHPTTPKGVLWMQLRCSGIRRALRGGEKCGH